ncbi:MAG: type II toxin-antitoxin system VapC family toxin [Candidatus Hydrothermarchaeales archaeon]
MLMIDSNIWAYFFDSNTPEHKKVKKPVRDAIGNNEILMSTVIQMELIHYLIKRLGPIMGGEKLDIFLNYPFKLDVLDQGLVNISLGVFQRYYHLGIGVRDASIIASMKRNDVTKLITHDKALKKIEEIELIDPVS